MNSFVMLGQLFLLASCIDEYLEDTIVKFDSLVFEAISNPKPHLGEHLLERISDLYMKLDDVFEKIKYGDEDGSEIVDRIINRGGLRICSVVQQNNTVLEKTYNLTADKVREVQEALNGTIYVWQRIGRYGNFTANG